MESFGFVFERSGDKAVGVSSACTFAGGVLIFIFAYLMTGGVRGKERRKRYF
jgi:hypothetical protein